MKQLAFYFDQTRCTGCDTCTIACRDWHDFELGGDSVNWRYTTENEEGDYPDISVSYFSFSCLHCAKPVCVEVCPTGAIVKRKEDGIVTVDREKCLGGDSCGKKCLEVCPYRAPRFGSKPNAKMQKCDFCLERWQEGRLPACVMSCPTRALDAGDLRELRIKYGKNTTAPGFKFSLKTRPSLIIKAKKRD